MSISQATQKDVVLISGGSRGLGQQLAIRFAQSGCSIGILGRDSDALNTTVQLCTKHLSHGQSIVAHTVDVGEYSEVRNSIDSIEAELGSVDVVVSNAGVYGPIGPLEKVDVEEWIETIQINLVGSMNLIRTVMRSMKTRRKGRIIQISGGGATKPMPNFSAYAASKAGVVRFIESLAEELKSFGIPANCVAPGPINTRLLSQVLLAGPELAGLDYYKKSLHQRDNGSSDAPDALDLVTFLSFDAPLELTGKLISAIWDDWRNQDELEDAIRDGERWTLRRVID